MKSKKGLLESANKTADNIRFLLKTPAANNDPEQVLADLKQALELIDIITTAKIRYHIWVAGKRLDYKSTEFVQDQGSRKKIKGGVMTQHIATGQLS